MSGLRRPAVEWRAAVTCNSVCKGNQSPRCSLRMGQPAASSAFRTMGGTPAPTSIPLWRRGRAGSSRAGHGRSTVPRGARALGSHRAARSVQRRFPGRSGRLSPAGDQSPAGCDAGSVCSARPVPCAPIRLPGRSDSHAPRVTRRQSQRHCLCPPPYRASTRFRLAGLGSGSPAGRGAGSNPRSVLHRARRIAGIDAARALAGERIELILRLAEAAQ